MVVIRFRSILQVSDYTSINVFFLRPRWTGFLSECIYLNNMHEVKRLKPTKSEIFVKMSLKIFCSASIIARDLFRVARTFCALLK